MIHIKYFFGNVYMAAVLGIAAILFILKYLQSVFGGSPPLLLLFSRDRFRRLVRGIKSGAFHYSVECGSKRLFFS